MHSVAALWCCCSPWGPQNRAAAPPSRPDPGCLSLPEGGRGEERKRVRSDNCARTIQQYKSLLYSFIQILLSVLPLWISCLQPCHPAHTCPPLADTTKLHLMNIHSWTWFLYILLLGLPKNCDKDATANQISSLRCQGTPEDLTLNVNITSMCLVYK